MHISRANEFSDRRRWHGSLYDIPYKYNAPVDYPPYADELYYPKDSFHSKDVGRTYESLFDDTLPAELLFGLEELTMYNRGPEKKEQNVPQEALDVEYYAKFQQHSGRSNNNNNNNQVAKYHGDSRNAKNRKAAGYFFSDSPTTWSQTRKLNLDYPITPVPIKIPLSQKHLWWESPTITLNMFAPYSSRLVKGEKTIETRNYQLPNKCKGVRIGIVEIMPKGLPSKKPELIGEVVFVDCKEYTSREQWEKDAPYHQVDVNDQRFGWKKNKKKFGWVVHTWQSYSRSIRQAASEHCNSRVHFTKNFFVWAYV